ncbi:exonuclease domain-containing protein [Trueperella sp. LYQ143]|uniref:exonuclease domain-containing protein n=1 Tax=Trueperella sp. LYQ143 TaxID=3391059 RepID=UPI00398322CA
MREFVAIDFETANEQRRSACSVGMVRFDSEGQIADRYYRLLRPHPDVDYFNPVHVRIHNIRPSDVAQAPQWNEVYGEVCAFIGERPIVAHNMAFDGHVLLGLARAYELPRWENELFCTVQLARRLLGDRLEQRTLQRLFAYYFPGESFTHHEALSDAQACGRIFARMQSEYGYENLNPTRLNDGSSSRNATTRVHTADRASAAELIQHYGHTAALEGERVLFTGTLTRAARSALQELVAAIGATPERSLTKKTTMLVVGVPNPRVWADESAGSRKLLAAIRMRDAGIPIRIITEEEFFNLLTD